MIILGLIIIILFILSFIVKYKDSKRDINNLKYGNRNDFQVKIINTCRMIKNMSRMKIYAKRVGQANRIVDYLLDKNNED
jgi:hypothetical protein